MDQLYRSPNDLASSSPPPASSVRQATGWRRAAPDAFIDRITTEDGTGIPGGIGGGANYESHAVFYVGVPDVETALQKAESLGGTRIMGPAFNEDGGVVVGHFTDPEGNLVGVAGPA
jgi:predicted enzyme related to lactoylglutathione lyase